MSLTATQLDGDFLKFDGLESVDYTAKRTDGIGEPSEQCVTIENALQRETQNRDIQLGSVTPDDISTVWHIRKSDLKDANDNLITPERGDCIADSDGNVWSIRRRQLQTLQTRWRLTCSLGED